MTEEFKAFRVLLVPLALLIVFLIMPKMCGRRAATPSAEQQQPATTGRSEASGGLRIEGTPIQGVEAKSTTFPEGLDAARVQYLVEINSAFSEPTLAKLQKAYTPDEVTQVLRSKNYIDIDPKTNAVTPSRDGLLNLNLTEVADGWTFPVAKRTFDKVVYVSRVEDDKYDVTISWHYDVTPIGTQLRIDGNKIHQAIAQFVRGPGGWDMSGWTQAPNDSK